MVRIRAAMASCVALGLLMPAGKARAGAWTMAEDHGQLIVTMTPSWADSVFGPNRSVRGSTSSSKFEVQALFEYGFTDRLTAIVSPGLQSIRLDAPVNATRSGLGYTEGGARYRFFEGSDWVLSGQATLRLPGTSDSANPAAVGYTGTEFDLRALVGYNFTLGNMPAYVDVQFAQRFRSGGPPNEFRADITLGVRAAPRWLVLAQLFNVFSEGSGSALFPSYDYHKLQLGVSYDLSAQWSLLAAGFTTFSGRNALQENGAVLGVWYRF